MGWSLVIVGSLLVSLDLSCVSCWFMGHRPLSFPFWHHCHGVRCEGSRIVSALNWYGGCCGRDRCPGPCSIRGGLRVCWLSFVVLLCYVWCIGRLGLSGGGGRVHFEVEQIPVYQVHSTVLIVLILH